MFALGVVAVSIIELNVALFWKAADQSTALRTSHASEMQVKSYSVGLTFLPLSLRGSLMHKSSTSHPYA